MCCCSAYIATIVAGILGIVESFGGLTWNLQLLMTLGSKANVTEFFPPIVDVNYLDDFLVVYAICVVSILLNTVWLGLSCVMLRGNSILKKEMITPWIIQTNLMVVLSAALGIYFFFQHGAVLSRYRESRSAHESRRMNYLRLAALFSGWFFVWPTVNLVLTLLVIRRYRDIAGYNETGLCLRRDPHTNTRCGHLPPPYTEQSTLPINASTSPDLSPITGWSRESLLEHQPLSNTPPIEDHPASPTGSLNQ